VATSTSEIVQVTYRETDGEDDVWLLDREASLHPVNGPRKRRAARPARRPAAKKGKRRP
jgi:hypothetical protein